MSLNLFFLENLHSCFKAQVKYHFHEASQDYSKLGDLAS
jgi:hypothetical protein